MTLTLPDDIIAKLEALANEQGRSPETVLRDLLNMSPTPESPSTTRIAGLNRGSTQYISDDFDDPLGDEFWLDES